MKKMIFWTLLLICIPMVSHGAGYVFANYGNGGKVGEASYGLEVGGIFLSPYHPTGGAFSIGIGASIADTDEEPGDASGSGKYNDGNEQEIYASFGAEIVPAFFGVAGLGYSFQNIKDATGSSSSDDDNVTWMLGMRYVVKWMNLGLGYDYRRGVVAGVGLAF